MSRRSERALAALVATLVALAASYPIWRDRARSVADPATDTVVLKDNTTASESLLRARAAAPRADPPLFEPIDVADAAALFGAPDEERLADPWTGFVYRPSHVRRLRLPDHPEGVFEKRTNSLGFAQDDELSPARDFLVLVGGDSHADGLCANAETFSSRIRDRLRERHPSLAIDVANAAESGYAFHQYLGLLHKHAELRPDVYVVAVYAGNDVFGTVKLRHYFARTMPPAHTHEHFRELRRARNLAAAKVANALGQLLYFRRYPEELEPSLANCLALAEAIERLAAERGTAVLWVVIPVCLEAGTRSDGELDALRRELDLHADWDHFERVADRLTADLRGLGGTVLDLREHFREPRRAYYWSDLHINLAGHALIAELLLPEIEAALARRRR